MNKKLEVEYNIDKLILVYEIPETFMNVINEESLIADIFAPSNVFIFTKKFYRTSYIVARYELSWRAFGDCNTIKIGEFRNDIEGCITLTVYNEILYSKHLHLLYEFERKYGLHFLKLTQLDVCCDASNDLPRKLNAIMHDKCCEVTRRGKKKHLTEHGNQYLGVRTTANIKLLGDKRERPAPSYYYELKSSGAKRPIILRGYNKTNEVGATSGKDYILNQYTFSPVHRLEVSVSCYDLTKLTKSKTGWSHEYIYLHLEDKGLLHEFFCRFLNRFAILTINGQKFSISGFLRL